MQLSPLADYTAGGESHPAPKNIFNYKAIIVQGK